MLWPSRAPAAERESGDVRLSGAKVQAEIGEILSGAVAAPTGRRIVFKSVGMAIEDLTAAASGVAGAFRHPPA